MSGKKEIFSVWPRRTSLAFIVPGHHARFVGMAASFSIGRNSRMAAAAISHNGGEQHQLGTLS